MSRPDSLRPDRSPQQDLQCHYASRQIEQTELLYPEFRLELVDGKFLIGGTIEGSRWLLKEALVGWGLESAIAFAPLDLWWSALQAAYQVSHQTPDDWLMWAESLPLSDDREAWWPPLGSRYGGEHRWVGDRLRQSLSHVVSQAGLGTCFGPHYGLWIGDHVFTPDILLVDDVRLAENPCYDCYLRGAAHLVIEIVLPEWADVDEQVRRQHYEQQGVAHYWTVNPIAQQVQFWQWSPEGYQARPLDADGCYRGVPGLTFTPDLLWVPSERGLGLPIVTSVPQQCRWQLSYEDSADGASWDSVPFAPMVGLEPSPLQPEQFIAWCPESKLEGGPFPLIGGGAWGTRNAIAMLIMSLGLIETVKLIPGYEWVRVLRRINRQQQQDEQQRQQWWTEARATAAQIQRDYQISGIGLIGDLLQTPPLHRWSEIHLMLWGVPESVTRWQIQPTSALPIRITTVEWASPTDWQAMQQAMTVLVGEWHGQESPRLHQRLQFQWREAAEV